MNEQEKLGAMSGTGSDAVEPFSRLWKITLAVCAAAIAVQSGLSLLSDPDLPTHLSLGEWILAHHRVPFTEPFAWTRAGAPFYAYSWLIQVVMISVLRVGGAGGLHLVAAAVGFGITVAAAAVGRALELKWPGAVLFGVASAMVALESTPFLRPQLFMHLLMPIAWMAAARLSRRDDGEWIALGLLVATSALAANTHITFPAIAVPLVLLLSDDVIRWPRFCLAAAAVILGWFLSPYALVWPEVFRLNFAANPLTTRPALSGELTPGFAISPWYGSAIAILPLLAYPALRRWKQRLVYGALWLFGLLLYARVFKGLGPWWWCATPVAIAALSRLPRASSQVTRLAFALLTGVFVASLAITNARLYALFHHLEGNAKTRVLPSVKAYAAEPALRWLEPRLRTDARGRVLTVFNYGSYVQWRLPSLSVSIDGRTIFPDSAALPDARASSMTHSGPWRSANLAIAPTNFPVADSLDRDAAWVRVGVAAPAPWAPSAPRAGLWVRRDWWNAAGKGAIVVPPDGVLR